MDFLNNTAGHVEALVTLVGALSAAHLLFYKKVLSPIKAILAEITPNGGASIKDAIDEIRDQVFVTTAIQDAVCQASDRGIWRADSKGKCLAINDAACRLAHRSAEDLLGDNWRACIPVPDRQNVVNEYLESVAQNRHFQMKYRYIAENGRLTDPVEVRGTPVIGPRGKAVGFVGFMWPADEKSDETPSHLGSRRTSR